MLISPNLRKPPANPVLRRGHPLAHGLEALIVCDRSGGAVFDAVHNRRLVMSTAARLKPNTDGGYALFGSANTTHFYPGSLFNKDISLFARFSHFGSNFTECLASHSGAAISFRYYIISDVSGNMNFRIVRSGSSGNTSFISPSTLPAGVPNNIGVSCDHRALADTRLFLNGSRVAATTSGLDANVVSQSNAILAIGSSDGSAEVFNGGIEIFGVWSRRLSDYDHQLLSSNPYDLIKPRKASIYFGTLPFAQIEATAAVTGDVYLQISSNADVVSQVQIVADLAVGHQQEVASQISAIVTSSASVFKAGDGFVSTVVSNEVNDGTINNVAGVVTDSLVTVNSSIVAYFRFEDVVIPSAVRVREASLKLTPTLTTTVATVAQVYAYNLSYAQVPSSYGDFLLQPKTQVVTVTIPPLTAGTQISIGGLEPIFQDLADRSEIQSPTAVVLFVDARSTNAALGFTAIESSTTACAKLFCEYGAFTAIAADGITASSSFTANIRLTPVVACDITVVTSISALTAQHSAISCDLQAVTEITAGVTPNPVEIAVAITATGITSVSSQFVSYSRNDIYAQVQILGEVRVTRVLPVSVGFDFTDTDNFQLRVSSVVVPVSA